MTPSRSHQRDTSSIPSARVGPPQFGDDARARRTARPLQKRTSSLIDTLIEDETNFGEIANSTGNEGFSESTATKARVVGERR